MKRPYLLGLLVACGWLGVHSTQGAGKGTKDGASIDQSAGWGDYWKDRYKPSPAYEKWVRDYSAASKRRDYAAALAVTNTFLAANPKATAIYIYRGSTNRRLGRFDEARADLEKGIAGAREGKAPKWVGFGLEQMAVLLLRQGRSAEAEKYFRQALRESPEESRLYNDFAWHLATNPLAGARNGAEALRLATKACESTRWADANCLDTIAAAYAETGDFASAVRWQNEALPKLAGDRIRLERAKHRLALYQAKQPYRSDN